MLNEPQSLALCAALLLANLAVWGVGVRKLYRIWRTA